MNFSVQNPQRCIFFYLLSILCGGGFGAHPLHSLSEISRSPAAISPHITAEVKRPAAAIMMHTANDSSAESGSI